MTAREILDFAADHNIVDLEPFGHYIDVVTQANNGFDGRYLLASCSSLETAALVAERDLRPVVESYRKMTGY